MEANTGIMNLQLQVGSKVSGKIFIKINNIVLRSFGFILLGKEQK